MTAVVAIPEGGMDLRATLKELEVGYILTAMELSGGTIRGAAKMLGLKRTTLSVRLKALEKAGLISVARGRNLVVSAVMGVDHAG
jgi:DNA-binding NtrC family response regulator